MTSNINDEEQENLISEISRVLKCDMLIYIADFLINLNKRNMKRYQKYKDKYGIYDVFKLPESAVLSYHTENHILRLTKDFKELVFEKTVYKKQ